MPQDGLKLRIISLNRPALSTGISAAVYLSGSGSGRIVDMEIERGGVGCRGEVMTDS